MIRAFVSIVVRSLVELALVLVVIAALLLALAGIVGQRIVTTNPNLVERAAERVAGVLAALARGARVARGTIDDGPYPEADRPGEEIEVRGWRGRITRDEWKGMVV